MSEERGGTPSSPESAEQLRSKLQGLERMRLAGLVTEKQYQSTLQRLQAQLDAAPVSAATPPSSDAPPPPPYAPPAAAQPSPIPTYAPPPPQPWQQVAPPRTRGMRTPMIATGIAIALLAATVAGIAVVTKSNAPAVPVASTATSTPAPTPTPTPDPGASLAALRNLPAAKGDFVVTPALAEQLVRGFWPVRENGLSRHNPDTIHAIENASAGEWDAIGCTLGCPPPSPRALRDVRVFVPLQKAYPATFMAQVLTTQYHTPASLVEIMVFTRQSASQPWFLSFDTSYSGLDKLHEFPVNDGSVSSDADPQNDPKVDRTALPGMLAAYWQHWKDTGSAPAGTRFIAGAFTTQQGQDIYATRQDDRTIGIDEHVTYSADPAHDGVWSFAVNATDDKGLVHSNYVLTCGTVRYRAVNLPLKPATAVVQVGLDPFGNLLAPGRYSSVTESGLHESCLLTHPGETFIEVEGLDGQQTKVFGVPLDGGGAAA
jgi:hypothetical protein